MLGTSVLLLASEHEQKIPDKLNTFALIENTRFLKSQDDNEREEMHNQKCVAVIKPFYMSVATMLILPTLSARILKLMNLKNKWLSQGSTAGK